MAPPPLPAAALGAPNRADEIFEELRRRILAGELAAGERLQPERELSVAFDTNRNTLREAIRKLEQERLVTVRHGQGVTAADFRRTATIDVLGPFLQHGADMREKARVLFDLLPARSLVVQYAADLATERADANDLARLADIAELAIAAFEGEDVGGITRAYQRWLDALIDAAHSVPIRWIANPFLEAERDVMSRFPTLWVLEPFFPIYLRKFSQALADDDGARARTLTREYFERIDSKLTKMLKASFPGAQEPPRAGSEAPKKKERKNGRAR